MAANEPPLTAALYVHVPFCARKCDYCAFYSAPSEGGRIQRYVEALVRELRWLGPRLARPLKTLFFGGGTPSLLTLRQWETVLGAIHELGLAGAVEWTVECNPATVSEDKARLLRDGGVNRISMGVQSFDDALLDRLGRVHSREMVFRSYDVLRAAGFDNVNLDLMFAIPGQTRETWRSTLAEAMALGPEHLASYEVIYEEDTALYAQLEAGEFEVDEDLAAALFEDLVETVGAAGWHQYEIANFARDARCPNPGELISFPRVSVTARELPAFACRHNVNYWRGGAYAAMGPAAAGFEGGTRYRNVSDTGRYCEQWERDEPAREGLETLSPLARAGELAAFGLRMNAGWPWEEFRSATGFELREDWRNEMDALERRGWGIRDTDRFRLTPAGLRFADAAGSEFLRPDPAPTSPQEAAWAQVSGVRLPRSDRARRPVSVGKRA